MLPASPHAVSACAAPVSVSFTRCPAQRRPRYRSCAAASVAAASDVLLVDAQNVLSRARAEAKRGGRLPGESGAAAAAFADWLAFLTALAQPQLLVAVFDAPRASAQQQPQRAALAPEYLKRRRTRQVQRQRGNSDTSSGSAAAETSSSPAQQAAPPAGDPLRPFKRQVEARGGVHLQAAAGWEADDGLAAAAAAACQRHPAARVVVASGDTDMQQLLSSQVAWLRLHGQPSLACPLGAELVTAAAFKTQHGFPPGAYADWLAFVGKKEASIGGAGVGGKSAAKLLARYGTVEAVLAAAEEGQLKGWGPAVQQLLGGGGGGGWEQREAQLRRNRQLFGACSDPAVVDLPGFMQLQAALERLQPAAVATGTGSGSAVGWGSSSGGGSIQPSAALAWQQPMFARRRRQLQQIASAEQLSCLTATPQGLAVDALLQGSSSGSAAGSNGGSRGPNTSTTALFLMCPCDMPQSSWQKAVAAAAGSPVGSDCTAALLPLVHGAMAHHLRLVGRAGYRVQLQLPGGAAGQPSGDSLASQVA